MAGSESHRIEELRRKWEADPGSRAYLQLADEYLKTGDLPEAASVLRRGLEERPGDLSGQVALGRCLVELGETEEATGRLEGVLEKDPAHIVANKLLIRAYLGSGRPEPARERLEIHRLLDDRDVELEELEKALERVSRVSSAAAGEVVPEGAAAKGRDAGADSLGDEADEPDAESAGSMRPAAEPPGAPLEPGSSAREGPSEPAPPEGEDSRTSGRRGEANQAGRAEPPASERAEQPEVSERSHRGRQPFELPALGASFGLQAARRVARSRGRSTPFVLTPVRWSAPGEDVFGLSGGVSSTSRGADDGRSVMESAEREAGDERLEGVGREAPIAAQTPVEPFDREADFDEGPGTSGREGDLEELSAAELEGAEDKVESRPEEEAWEPPALEELEEEPEDAFAEVAPEQELEEEPDLSEGEGDGLELDARPESPEDLEGVGELRISREALEGPASVAAEETSGAERPSTTATLGELYLKQGHLDEAEGIFSRLLEAKPDSVRARWGLSRVRAARPSAVVADDLLAQVGTDEPPEGLTAKKVQVLASYIDHLRRGARDHVH